MTPILCRSMALIEWCVCCTRNLICDRNYACRWYPCFLEAWHVQVLYKLQLYKFFLFFNGNHGTCEHYPCYVEVGHSLLYYAHVVQTKSDMICDMVSAKITPASPRAHLHMVGMLWFVSLTLTYQACPLLLLCSCVKFMSLWLSPVQLYFIP